MVKSVGVFNKTPHCVMLIVYFPSHFSPFVFTQTLLPLLKQTAKEPESDVRIVNVRAQLPVMLVHYLSPVFRSLRKRMRPSILNKHTFAT